MPPSSVDEAPDSRTDRTNDSSGWVDAEALTQRWDTPVWAPESDTFKSLADLGTDPSFLASLALESFESGDYSAAIHRVNRAYVLASLGGLAIDLSWRELEAAALLKLGRYEEALVALQAAIVLAPSEPRLLSNKGWVLHYLGRDSEAEVLLDRAIALAPTYPRALRNRSAIRANLGKLHGAAEDLVTALALEDAALSESFVGC